jgi:hypothetical protein
MGERKMTKPIIYMLLLAGILAGSMAKEKPSRDQDMDFSAPELTIYQIASIETGCPEWILEGLRFAESSYGKNIKHPDPLDKGDFGLHESVAIRKERVAKWGEYNPYCPLQSAIIAGHIIMEHYQAMGDMDGAISAYRHGRTGTYKKGIDWKYVDRVKNGGLFYNI